MRIVCEALWRAATCRKYYLRSRSISRYNSPTIFIPLKGLISCNLLKGDEDVNVALESSIFRLTKSEHLRKRQLATWQS